MIKVKLPCPPGVAEKVTAAAQKEFQDVNGARLNDADGLRVDLDDSWVCVRASNTEPIIRIIAEAGDREAAEALIERVRRLAEPIIDAAS